MSNGLPSNHIYGLRTDRNGYLWIATPEGISRYNGYGVQVFNTSDGLPTSDIWEMFEDKKGRLWLMNFSQTLGYIVNGQYRSAVIRDSLLRVLPVAHSVGNHEQGVFFVNVSKGILVEYNDTFYYSG